jgi:hypothetical protein
MRCKNPNIMNRTADEVQDMDIDEEKSKCTLVKKQGCSSKSFTKRASHKPTKVSHPKL